MLSNIVLSTIMLLMLPFLRLLNRRHLTRTRRKSAIAMTGLTELVFTELASVGLVITGLTITLLPIKSVHAAVQTPPWIWTQGSLGISTTTEYFQTSANYSTSRGEFERLVGNNKATAWQNDFRGRYAFTRWMSTYAGMGYSNVRVVDIAADKNNAGLSAFNMGADFLVTSKWLRLIPEIEVGYPIDPASSTQKVPLTNEGVPWMRASAFIQKPFRFLNVYGHAGLRIPTQGLAKTFLYGAGAELAFANFMKIGGGIEGYETVLSDDLTEAERNRTSTNSMGGSHLFWAYNPALLEARAWVGFKPVPALTIRAGYAKTLNGVRSAEGQAFLLTLAYNATPRSFKTPDSLAKRQTNARKKQENALDSFDVETEQTDPDLFEPSEQYVPTDKSGNLNEAEKLLESR
jgi:opacity protein-like surface antigen